MSEEKIQFAKKIERVMEILRSHDISMEIFGCGCCGSPNIKFVYKGETIVDDSDVNFDMFKRVKE